MKINNKILIYFLVIFLVCLILFFKPVTSGKPLGLDALGHLSKVSYLQQFPFADWDMSWYSGSPFLKMYSPLIYYLEAFFPAIIAMDIISFLSIFLCAIGIFLLVNFYTKNQYISFLSSLSFFTVLSLSYYYICVGNHPWVSALWTIPFSLYFLELSLKNNKKKYFVAFVILFAVGILIHVAVGFLIGLIMAIRIFDDGFTKNNLKKFLFYGGTSVLISSFWFFPFLAYRSNFLTGGLLVPPTPEQLFGFNNYITWGSYSAGIGILAFLFIFSLLFFNRYYKDKNAKFLLIVILILGIILFGGLFTLYPYGVEPVRFILPFSIFLAIFVGAAFSKVNKKVYIILTLLILAGLIWNFSVVNYNFERFSYNTPDSRYGVFQNIMQDESFPIKNEFSNYRFGDVKYVFGENLNYFYPSVSQTFGYQDAGMLNPPRFYDMKWNIWASKNVNDSIYWLDAFGIKYFVVNEPEADDEPGTISKFANDSRFKIVMNYSDGFNFILFKYKDAKKILSLVDSVNSTKEKNCSVERNNPDKVVVTFDNYDQDDVVIFKEFYHDSWKAKDFNSGEDLPIQKTDTGMMYVHPVSDGVVFYQTKKIVEIFGILFSILGIIILILIRI